MLKSVTCDQGGKDLRMAGFDNEELSIKPGERFFKNHIEMPGFGKCNITEMKMSLLGSQQPV